MNDLYHADFNEVIHVSPKKNGLADINGTAMFSLRKAAYATLKAPVTKAVWRI